MSENEEKIHVEEEPAAEKNSGAKNWTEELKVAGEELLGTIKQLYNETTVRRIVIINEAKGIHFEVPMVLGVVGIALLPVYSAIALIAALVTDCKIVVERSEKAPAEPAEAV
ncbi:MAG: DUF4342 domain-containing protein [Ardenticatenaceae bacterium]|nr:DUF4342 domain-containing protein [Ardenticatenaceae bacterium]